MEDHRNMRQCSDIIRIRDDIPEIKEALARIEAALGGNGTPGLKERIMRIETWGRAALVIFGIIATLSTVATVYTTMATAYVAAMTKLPQ